MSPSSLLLGLSRSARVLSAVAACLATVAPLSAVAQPRCEAPRVLLTVDRSSSMLGTLPGGGTKWDAARSAIGSVTGAFADRIDFGLQPFPYPDRCEPGQITLAPGANDSATILTTLGGPPPDGGNYTPMAQTLDAILDYAPMLDRSRDNHVILVTDGWQWCSPYEASTRFTPVESVMRLRAAGITVHVVGFGAAVDSLTLNRAAVAAGTDLPGCDPTLSDPMAMGHCYMQAHDMVALRDALRDIARDITDEVCDGLDNDCDGAVDEGFDVDGDGVRTCDGDCDDADPTAHPGAEELCDEIDNDCDGETDTGCDCVAGDSRSCGSAIGACTAGSQSCLDDGTWGACDGATSASAETCDGLDDDCDGRVDEATDCGEFGACIDGGCMDVRDPDPGPAAMDPVPEDEPSLVPQEPGCACQAAGGDGGGSAAIPAAGLALLGLTSLLLGRRRRR